jgi:transaldolase
MKSNPLVELEKLGQSIWLDYIQRDLLRNGRLKRMINEDGLSGMTSNPAIFEKAILESRDYDADIRTQALAGRDAKAIFDTLSVRDVQNAADTFRPLYDRTSGAKGYVSLEVNPHLAHDTRGTVEEAHRLWTLLNRPNVFIKIPATDEGLPAIRQLISDGININVTLLFGLTRYHQVIEAYISGIEYRLGQGKPLDHVASVASFFVSRMDSMVDPLLEQLIAKGGAKAELARQLRGRVAVANSKAAFRIYKEAFAGDRFNKLVQHGARKQWLLWASTSTKVPEYSDVKYIEELIAPDTVNTVPLKTLDAYRDHGKPEIRIERDMEAADRVLAQLPELGINLDYVTQQLENEGDAKFTEPFDHLIETLKKATQK